MTAPACVRAYGDGINELAARLQRRNRGKLATVALHDASVVHQHGLVSSLGGLPLWHECCARELDKADYPVSRAPAAGKPTRRVPNTSEKNRNSIAGRAGVSTRLATALARGDVTPELPSDQA